MKRYPAYIFDLDGTLYRGEDPIPHAVEVLNRLKAEGSQVRYLTNNSSRTREFFTAKLRRMGFEAQPDEIYSSAGGAASYLSEAGLKRVFVVGEQGLIDTLESGGLTILSADQPADAVLAGICRTFTYSWMNDAMQLIRAGAKFVATNRDPTFPLEAGSLAPGAGSIVAALATCSGVEPFVVGKPNPFLIELALRESALRAEDALVVGDRIDTDVHSGEAAGCPTFLVLTGVETQAPVGQAWGDDLRALL